MPSFRRSLSFRTWALVAALTALAPTAARAQDGFTGEIRLRDNWQLQSSALLTDTGETISSPDYQPMEWYGVSVPTTLLAALAGQGIYPNPYFGDNLTKIPGYKPGRWLAMAPDSPFYPSWWYRREFSFPDPEAMKGRHAVLHLDGINYEANVWVNGKRIADRSTVRGMFRRFEFPLDEFVRFDQPNVVAIEVTGPAHVEDKPYRTKQIEATTGWDDHNPQPPDANTGIWQDVYVTVSGPVALRHPYVSTDLDLPSLDVAHLAVSVEARNVTDTEQTALIAGRIRRDGVDVPFEQEVKLGPGETRKVAFAPQDYPQLNLDKPALWWPHPLGPQDLHTLSLEARSTDSVSDTLSLEFGVREATTYIDDEGWRGYKVNGRNVLIRGGAWMTADMLLRLDERRYAALVQYARDANLNMLRSEGFSIRETDEFYRLCDRAGVMVTQQIFGRSIPDEALAIDCIRDTLLRIRNHPSLVHFLGHDETFPTETLDQAYKDMIAELTPERTYQPHSGAFDVEERFQTGGTRTGTRELWTYANPAHYYTHKEDGAWGFAQSGGIGGVFAPIDSIRRMMPESALWPPTNPTWSLHTVIQGVGYFDALFQALERRYGPAENIEQLVAKGEAMNYESARGMYEAYARNKYDALGITTWKYDAAWPAALTWQYVDWYLRPTGAYYGAKKACEPVHAQYSYDDHSVWIVNTLNERQAGLKVTARVFDLAMVEQASQNATLDVDPDGKAQAFVMKWPENVGKDSKTFFLRLDLVDGAGKIIGDNLYWLSTVPDVPGNVSDDDRNFSVKPQSTADMTALASLPRVELNATQEVLEDAQGKVRVTLENPSKTLAFFIRLDVLRGENGNIIAPVYWTDNLISLLPGEKRSVVATFDKAELAGAQPAVQLRGWNVNQATK